MLLAIDIGNTNVTVGLFRGEKLIATWRAKTDVHRQPDEYAVLLMNLLSHNGIPLAEIRKAAIASTVPPLITTFEELSREYFHVNPLVVGAGTKTGMRVLYENPKDVGADRVVDAVAGYKLYGAPLIIVDFGTATVFDAVTKDGDYLGGAIAPGIGIAAEALFEHASKLPRIELLRPKTAIGRNTVSSMQSGLIFGYVGLIEGLVERFKRELGAGAKVVATGGLVGIFAKETKVIDIVDRGLTLTGLRMLHELNEKPGTA